MSTPRDPEEITAAGAPAVAAVPADTRIGAVHLSVSDLARSVAYYEQRDRPRVHGRGDGRAALGAGGEELLVLVEEPGARPARGYSGLYHFALLVPERADLARWLAHAARERVPLVGVVRPLRQRGDLPQRPRRARDRGLLGPAARGLGGPGRRADDDAAARRRRPARRARRPALGAVRRPRRRDGRWATSTCSVAEIPATIAFYCDVLGFGLMAQFGAQAAFLSAGGYHHHLGANTWESRGAPPAPAGPRDARAGDDRAAAGGATSSGLAHEAAVAGAEPERREDGVLVRDPSGNPVLLTPRP